MANRGYIVFTANADVPQYSTIASCRAILTAYSSLSTSSIKLKCYFVNADNPSAPANKTELDAYSLTSGVDWNDLVAWVDGEEYSTPGLSSILQEIIDQWEISSGQRLILIIEEAGSVSENYREWSSVRFDGGSEAAELEIEYIPPPQISTPEFVPPAGSYRQSQSVEIRIFPTDSNVYYTDDETDPDENSTPYSGAIQVSDSITLKVRAYKERWTTSLIASGYFSIGPIVLLPAGYYATYMLIGKEIWEAGEGEDYRLGNNSTADVLVPTQPSNSPSLIDGSGSYEAFMGLLSDNSPIGWGYGYWGDASGPSNKQVPGSICGGQNFDKIYSGEDAAYGLDSSGNLWAWGLGSQGELGVGDTNQRLSPVQVSGGQTWTDLANSSRLRNSNRFCLALNNAGRCYSWGNNSTGQCGRDYGTSPLTSPAMVSGDHYFDEIGTGVEFSIARKSNGSLWACGENGYGQLGIGDYTDRTSGFVDISAPFTCATFKVGYRHVIALDSNGDIWTWGYNNGGQLGTGDTTTRNAPVKITTSGGFVQISTSLYYNYALYGNDQVWFWGYNFAGAFGNNEGPGGVMHSTMIRVSAWESV